jgi:uncharacterized protein Yka (UPF0111/DUF47 family)
MNLKRKSKIFKSRTYFKLVENEIKLLRNLIQHLNNIIDKMNKMLMEASSLDPKIDTIEAKQIKHELWRVKDQAQTAEQYLVIYLDHYKF